MPGISSLCPMECFTTCRSTRSTTGRTTSLTLSRFPTHPAPASLLCVNGKLKMRRPPPSSSAFRMRKPLSFPKRCARLRPFCPVLNCSSVRKPANRSCGKKGGTACDSYSHARQFPAGQPDVLGDPAGGVLSESLRPLSAPLAGGPGYAERVRHRTQCRCGGRRIVGIDTRFAVCRCAVSAAQPLGRPRPYNRGPNEEFLRAFLWGARQGYLAPGSHAGIARTVRASLLLGAVCARRKGFSLIIEASFGNH